METEERTAGHKSFIGKSYTDSIHRESENSSAVCYLLFVLAVLLFSAAESDGLDGSDNSCGIR